MSVLCLGKLRSGRALALFLTAFIVACGVPDFALQGPTDGGLPSGGASVGGMLGSGTTGGATATATTSGGGTGAVDGGSTVATGGQTQQDAFNCKTSNDCSTFAATKVCDTSVNRCVECLPSVTDCDNGLYCGPDKVCHVGCATDTDCGEVVDCDASQCDPLKCDTATHQCKGCTADLDCKPGTICELTTGNCVPSCIKSSTCPTGWACCAAQGCVNPLSDAANCASCGTSCDKPGANAQCLNGTCRIDCKENYLDCNQKYGDGCEVDKLADNANCGCGIVCTGTQICRGGVCGDPSCTDKRYADCDNNPANSCETNIDSNILDCGACNVKCNATNGTPTCTGGQCAITCNAGNDNCDKDITNGCETNLKSSVAHCGSCSKVCQDLANGTATCVDGTCGISNCQPPFGDCDNDPTTGCEANENTDPKNCGNCGTRCSFPNATAVCTVGVCSIGTCNDGFADCDGLASNGCEVNIKSGDTNNCSACGAKCAPANGVGQCINGICSVVSCASPYQDCNKTIADGCEASTASNVSNCGSCGNSCDGTHGTPTCAYDLCGITCAPGFGNCDADAKNGCEAFTTVDPLNCGTCQNACASNNASLGTCVNSTCSVGACAAGFADCNGKYSDGCEAQLAKDVANCGTCGAVCGSENGNASCIDGKCSLSCAPGFGDCDTLASTGCETDITSSLMNCSACGKTCAPANAIPSCSSSICSGTCMPGFDNCDAQWSNGCEANLKTDASNCNACSAKCLIPNATAICNSGKCAIGSCNTGFMDCNGNSADGCEVNITADPNHCNDCSKVCVGTNGSAICTNGVCGINCSTGFGNCDDDATNGCEVNLAHDVLHCGGTCATAVVCPTTGGNNRVCNGGICGFDSCTAPLATCSTGGTCGTNLSNDVNNCGACSTKCSFNNAAASCVSSVCTMGLCTANYGDCDKNPANGCESSLKTDLNNCGTCGNKCNLANATAVCTNGGCAIASCNAGYYDCDGVASNGCEVNLKTDIKNCNACNTACSAANGTASCTNGACGITCNAGFDNCDGNVANGCEVNLKTDTSHCGTCPTVCTASNGTPACNNGTCGIVCASGYGDCDGNLANGCETNITNNKNYCGSCTTACNATNGTASCTASTCHISCNSGFGDCDGLASNGCEVNYATDPAHCGSCTTACTYTNATGVCSAGACQLGSCNANYGNCDTLSSTGCEAPLNTSTNCLSCGVACTNSHGGTSCGTTGCSPTCDAGYASCDSNLNNGCEQSISNDVNHCGSCTNVCPAYANAATTCTNSTCAMGACATNYGDCNTSSTDGCETSLVANTSHCGSCTNACSSNNGTPACSAGACSITCNTGYKSCNGDVTDGCEVNLMTDASNCGTCGHVCANGCQNGVCLSPCSYYTDCTATGMTIASAPAINTSYKVNANTCYEYISSTNLNGGTCQNLNSPNTMSVNGTSESCSSNWSSIPAKVNGGYCFHSFNAIWTGNTAFNFW